MSLVHRLVGYDRRTDRMKTRCDIPPDRLAEAERVAGVAPDDPDAAWSYALSATQARHRPAHCHEYRFRPSGILS
jgi:hypothetical protein